MKRRDATHRYCEKGIGQIPWTVNLGVQPSSEQRTVAFAVLGYFPLDNTRNLLFWVSSESKARMGAEVQPFDLATEM